jgi:flagellar hook-length control protein FliK
VLPVSTVASPSPTHGLHASQARQSPAPQTAAPETPFSALLDTTANDPAPSPPPAAQPATQSSPAKDSKDTKATKDAQKDSAPSNQDNSANAATSAAADDTAPATIAGAVAAASDAAKGTASKAGVATPHPDPTTGTAPDPATKQDGDTNTTAATAAVVTTVAPPVVAAVVAPIVTPQNATPAHGEETATAVAAIAATAATTATASTTPAAATQVLADAAATGAVGVATTVQAAPGQKPTKPVTAAQTPSDTTLAADPTPVDQTANPNGPAAGPAVAGTATGNGDGDPVNGAESHPAARPAKTTTTDEDSVGPRADQLANAQPDKLGAPADTPAQPGQVASAADQAAAAAPQSVASTSAAAAINAANAPGAPAAQATAAMAAVPLAGVAVEIAARAQAGSNHFEIRLDPPDLGRIDVRLNVDKQGNVTSHLVVERSTTLDMLRRDAPQLERALQDAGLKTSGDGLQFSLRDHGAGGQSQNFQDNGAARSARVIIPTDDVPTIDTARNYGRLYGLNGGLDIRV